VERILKGLRKKGSNPGLVLIMKNWPGRIVKETAGGTERSKRKVSGEIGWFFTTSAVK
jgi:hypothetical protein